MKKLGMIGAAACTCLLAWASTLDGGEPLNLRVAPMMASAPAFVRVSASVERNDDNRSLEIVAQSTEFFRSSRVGLDGRNAPRLAVFEYPNLPAGVYEIRGVLNGTEGKRVTVLRIVNIVAGAPQR